MAKTRKQTEKTALRRKAEELVSSRPKPSTRKSKTELDALVHELEVHQIELEMQNDELRTTQHALEDSYRKVTDLYDYAPVGYLSIDRMGLIIKANLTATELLGYQKRFLTGKPFTNLVHRDDKDAFHLHLRSLLAGSSKVCEIRLNKKGRVSFDAQLVSVPFAEENGNGGVIHIAILDISERRQAQREAADQMALLEAIIESSESPIFAVDRDYRYICFNSSHAATMQALFGADIRIGGNLLHYHTNSDNRAACKTNIERTLGGETVVVESYAGEGNREIRYFRIVHKPISRAEGGAAVYAQDLTGRKAMEEELRRATHDLGERVKELNCLYELSEVTARPGIELQDIFRGVVILIPPVWQYPEITVGRIMFDGEVYQSSTLGESVSSRKCAIRVSGRDRGFVEAIYTQSRPESFEGTFTIEERKLLDAIAERLGRTVERRETIKALRESEERYHSLFENANDSIFILDPGSGKIIDLNPSAANLLGYSPDELLGTEYRDFHLPDDFDRVNGLIGETSLLESVTDEHLHRRKDGDFRIVEMSGTVVELNGKKVFQSTCRDVTDRRNMERALQQYADELLITNKELESFSYSIAHDLRAPLRAMKGFSNIILEDFSDKLDKDMSGYFDRIVKNADKMDELITDMLYLSKISRQEMNLQEVDMSAMAGALVDDLRHAEPQRKVEVIIAEGIRGYADKRLLRIALSNLLGNAWKYSGKTPDARIEFGIQEKDGGVIYYIRDNGAGFSMSQAQDLFTPFKRLHSDNQFPGTGIGLAIVNRIIQRHRGRIWAESEKGKGATFYFKLSVFNKD